MDFKNSTPLRMEIYRQRAIERFKIAVFRIGFLATMFVVGMALGTFLYHILGGK